MDSRERFVIIFTIVILFPFTIFTFLNTNDLGLYASSFAIIYFALRLLFSPKLALKVDVLGLVLLAIFAYYVIERIISILGAVP